MASPSSACHLKAGSLGELTANLFLGFAYRNSILLNGKGRLAGGFVLLPNLAAGGSQSPPQCFSSCGKGNCTGTGESHAKAQTENVGDRGHYATPVLGQAAMDAAAFVALYFA
jgi:hypothetical protein